MKGCRQRGHALFVYINIDAQLEGLLRLCTREIDAGLTCAHECLCVANYGDDEVEQRCRVGTCVLTVHLHQSALPPALSLPLLRCLSPLPVSD